MSTPQVITSDDAQYKQAREAQKIFGDAIKFCMDGKKDKLAELTDGYLSANPHVSAQEMFSSFQSEGRTLLHIAATSGHAPILEYILSKCSAPRELVNLADDKGFTPLINATISESDAMIDILIGLGADVNASNKDGATAVHFAAGDGSVTRLNRLKSSGASLALASKAGTPLHWAAGKGRSEAIKYLVQQGVDINAVDGSGVSAVLMAAVSSSDEGVKCLVEAGADVGLVVAGNITLLHICSENGLIEAVKAIINTPIGKKCCSIETSEGNTPLNLAAMANNEEIVKVLIPVTPKKSAGETASVTSGEEAPISYYTMADLNIALEDGKERMRQWEIRAKAAEEESKRKKEASSSQSTEANNANKKVSTRELEPTNPPATPEAFNESEILKKRGNELYLAKDYVQAIEAYTGAIRLCGNSAPLWANRSMCYLQLGDAPNALLDAEVCRNLDPKWPKGCYRLAAARLELGLYEDAALAAFEGCKLDESNKELKKLLQLAVAKGKEAHQKSLNNSSK